MGPAEKKAFLEHFEDLEDPRSRRSPHDLEELLLTAICAVLSGADTWAAVALWGRAKLDWLRRFLPFENGVASHDTFGRVFALPDAAVFEERFIRWMRSVCGGLRGPAGRPRRQDGAAPEGGGRQGDPQGVRVRARSGADLGAGEDGREVERDHRHS